MFDEGIPLWVTPRLSNFSYNNQFCRATVVLLYDENTVDVGYNQRLVEVDNIMYNVVHDNYWLKLMTNKIVDYFLFLYHLSTLFVKNLCFCQSLKNSTYCRPCTNIFNPFVFNRWIFRCWIICLKYDNVLLNPYFLLYFFLHILNTNFLDNWYWKKKQNYNIVINNLQVKYNDIFEWEVNQQNKTRNYSWV